MSEEGQRRLVSDRAAAPRVARLSRSVTSSTHSISPLWTIGILSSFVTSVVVFAVAGLPMWLVLLASVNVAAIIMTSVRSGRTLLTPTLMYAYIFTGFGVLGYFVYPFIESYGRTPGHNPFLMIISDDSVRQDAFGWFAAASLSVMVGSWVTRGRSAPATKDERRSLSIILDKISRSNLPIYFAAASLALNLSVRSFDELLSRQTYHIETEIGGVATYLQLPAIFMLGMILRRRNIFMKLIVVMLALSIVALSFALSSRMLSLSVLMFFAGVSVSARRLKWLPLVIGVFLAFVMMPIPIYMRGLPEQGLLPNLDALPRVPLFSEESYWSTAGNLLSAFNVVALTGDAPTIPWESAALSILPFPGSVFGGSSAGAELRINFAIPYAGLGEIANRGALFFLFFFLLLGIIVGWVEVRTDRLRQLVGPTAETLLPLAVAALAAFLFVQYNLRTAMRLEYVLIACGVYVSLRVRVMVRANRGVTADMGRGSRRGRRYPPRLHSFG